MPGLAAIASPAAFGLRWSQSLADAVAAIAWSGDGIALLTGTADGRLLRIGDDGRIQTRWQGHDGGVTRLELQPGDERVLATAGEDGRVVLWDSATGEQQALLAEEGSWVEQLTWTPDGKVLAAAARKTISLWRGEESLGIWYDGRRQVLAMDWAPDSRRLATASNKGLYLWRLDTAASGSAEPMQLLSFPGAPVSVAWQPKGQALAVGTQDGFLQVWRQAAGGNGPRSSGKASQLTMRGYPGKVSCLAWHPTRPLIATAGGPDVVLWNLPATGKGAKGQPLRHHQKTVTALAWSPDGRLLAAGDRTGQLSLWDARGSLLFAHSLGDEISALAWHPDGTALAVGDTGGRLRVFVTEASNNTPSMTSPDLGDNP
jgi:WD40 repeat protein